MRHQPHEPGFYYSAGVFYKEGLHAKTPIGYGLVVIGVGFVRVSLRAPCPRYPTQGDEYVWLNTNGSGCDNGGRSRFFSRQPTPASSAGVSLAAALRAATRFVDRNRHRLQRRLNQAERYAHVMEPALQFVFHRSPLG